MSVWAIPKSNNLPNDRSDASKLLLSLLSDFVFMSRAFNARLTLSDLVLVMTVDAWEHCLSTQTQIIAELHLFSHRFLERESWAFFGPLSVVSPGVNLHFLCAAVHSIHVRFSPTKFNKLKCYRIKAT